MPEPMVQEAEPELVVARGSALSQTAEPLTPAAEPAATAPEPFRKQDWL